ncbi:MAG TPA: hypothetical protein ENJ37_02150 [Deltaproteobacteria bacterium]|nr:hypothetical protein [Deltaproteobacteria bacterium]
MEQRYVSNPRYLGTGSNTKGDMRTTVQPRMEFAAEGRRYRLSADYSLSYRAYARTSELDYLAHSGKVGLEADLTPTLKITVGDTLTYTEDSLEATATGIQTTRTAIVSNSVEARARYTASQKTTLLLSATETMLDYEDPALFDSRTDTFSAGSSYALSTRTTVGSSYMYTRLGYSAAGRDVDFGIHSLSLSLGRQLVPTLKVDLSAGAVYTPDLSSEWDWTAGASVVKDFQAASASLTYSRSITHSSGLAGTVNINEVVMLALDKSFSRGLDWRVFAAYYKNRSKAAALLDYESVSAGTDLNWRPYLWLALSAGYIRFEQSGGAGYGTGLTRDEAFVKAALIPAEWRF